MDCPAAAARTYQWVLDGVDVPGATAASYVTDPRLAPGSHAVDARISCTTGSTCVARLPSPVSIRIAQPLAAIAGSMRICAGSVATLDGTPSRADCPGGGPLAFQWVLDGSDVPGATGSRYTTGPGLPVGPHTVGLRIACVADPACGDVADPPLAIEVVDAAACCVAPPGAVFGLAGVKDWSAVPARDLRWQWLTEGGSADGYRLYAVAAKWDVPQARAPFASPAVCTTARADQTACVWMDALRLPDTRYTNVVGACGSQEGP